MTDALGNSIEIGKRYGYSRNESGYSYVRIGKITANGVWNMRDEDVKYLNDLCERLNNEV